MAEEDISDLMDLFNANRAASRASSPGQNPPAGAATPASTPPAEDELFAAFQANKAKRAAAEEAAKPLPDNPQDLATYENMPYGEVARYGVKNAIPSFTNAVTGLAHAVVNPSETAGALGSVGRGFAGYMTEPTGEPIPKTSSATLANRNMAVTPRNMAAAAVIPEEARNAAKRSMFDLGSPEQQAQDRAAAAAMAEPFTSEAGFKKALATDPFTVISLAAAPVTAGGGALSTAGTAMSRLGTLGKVANVITQPVAKSLQVAGTLMDPVAAAVGTAQLVGKTGKTLLGPGAQSVYTGAPKSAFEAAYEAGKSTVPELKEAFNQFAKGEGTYLSFSQAVKDAFDEMRSAGSREWAQKKGALTGATTQDIPVQPIYDAIDKARSDLPSRKVAAANPGSAEDLAHLELDKLENQLLTIDTTAAGDAERKLAALDKFKQATWVNKKAQGKNDLTAGVYSKVHAGIKQAIRDVAPEYDELMGQYQHLLDTLQEVEAASGASGKTNATAQMAKAIKSLKTPNGVTMLQELAKYDPRIPYMAAGAALQPKIASGLVQKLFEGGGLTHAAGSILNLGAGGNPLYTLLALGGFGVQAMAQSPNIMGGLNYRAGQVAGSLPAKGIRAGAEAAQAASPGIINLEREERQKAAPHKAGGSVGRVRRASGGKVAHDIQPLVSRLMGLAEQAKKATDNSTKPLLDAPDASIVKALRVANEAI